jgi:hypothetical protein
MQRMGTIVLAWHDRIYDKDARSGESTDSARRPRIKCSQRFLAYFMHQNYFRYRCVQTTRRREIRLEEVTRFEKELSTTYHDLPKTHIVNADESI